MAIRVLNTLFRGVKANWVKVLLNKVIVIICQPNPHLEAQVQR